MATLTPNLQLIKPDTYELIRILHIRTNVDILDVAFTPDLNLRARATVPSIEIKEEYENPQNGQFLYETSTQKIWQRRDAVWFDLLATVIIHG